MNVSSPRCVGDQIVAEMFSVKVKTLRNWRSLRKGPPYLKVYGKVLYDLDDTAEWFKSWRIVPEEQE